MKKQYITIEGIPAMVWGSGTGRLFVAVHGDQSHKEDTVIALFAEAAMDKGHRVLSLDLPRHGSRKEEPRLCNAQNSVADLQRAMGYARNIAEDIGVFGCSMGAYFSMLAYREAPICQALFLSPVVDMKQLIHHMMAWFGVSEERLRLEGTVQTPAQTLEWDDYQYVLSHPVVWDKPTAVLYGGKDSLCSREGVQGFAERSHGDLTVWEDGEHHFHTAEQLAVFRLWLQKNI